MVETRVEGYLINLSLTYESVDENVWHINDEEKGLGHVIVFAEDSLVTIRAKVMELPKSNKEGFLEELLRLNIDMVHGAYALEDNNVIIIDTLELSSMDLEEFQASLDAIGLALAQHYPKLSRYRDRT